MDIITGLITIVQSLELVLFDGTNKIIVELCMSFVCPYM